MKNVAIPKIESSRHSDISYEELKITDTFSAVTPFRMRDDCQEGKYIETDSSYTQFYAKGFTPLISNNAAQSRNDDMTPKISEVKVNLPYSSATKHHQMNNTPDSPQGKVSDEKPKI